MTGISPAVDTRQKTSPARFPAADDRVRPEPRGTAAPNQNRDKIPAADDFHRLGDHADGGVGHVGFARENILAVLVDGSTFFNLYFLIISL